MRIAAFDAPRGRLAVAGAAVVALAAVAAIAIAPLAGAAVLAAAAVMPLAGLRLSAEAPPVAAGVVAPVAATVMPAAEAQATPCDPGFEDWPEAAVAKTRFLARVSHELRTPLNAILGFSELLRHEFEHRRDPVRHLDYIRLINEASEHLLQVVNGILDMSKIDAGNFQLNAEPFELGALIETCVEMMAPQVKAAGVALRTEVPAGISDILADRRACKQMLLNLISNASKFTDEGGEIVVGARAEGSDVIIFVRDNGIGIAAEDVPRLGQPFVQAGSGLERRHDGTGLGLSVVKGLATLHGGSMKIESRLGHGTTVSVRLPSAVPATATVPSVPAVAAAPVRAEPAPRPPLRQAVGG